MVTSYRYVAKDNFRIIEEIIIYKCNKLWIEHDVARTSLRELLYVINNEDVAS